MAHRARVVPKEDRFADGIQFGSRLEMQHYFGLKALQKDGKISQLQHEPQFVFIVNGHKICTYKPDFSFIETATNLPKIHDVKGWKKSAKTGKMLPRVNREFHIKKALMLALFDLTVECV